MRNLDRSFERFDIRSTVLRQEFVDLRSAENIGNPGDAEGYGGEDWEKVQWD